jgi:hypothetical protein
MISTAPSRKSEETEPAPSMFPLGKIWTAARRRPHLAHALDLFALGTAAWNLRQTFEEVVRELGPQPEAWIAARGRAVAEECAWFRATVLDRRRDGRPSLAVWISLAEEPDACDATPRRQRICEERSRGTGPPSLQGRTFMSTV